MAYTIPANLSGNTMVIRVTGVAGIGASAIAAVPNPWGSTVLILRATWYLDTISAGAANINIGVGATSVTDSSDLISALAVGANAGVASNCHIMQNAAKTAVTVPAQWTSTSFINFSGSASTVGMVGHLFLECLPLT